MTGLDDHQRGIADCLEGILCVDAGPGTGKTRTITRRFISIVESGVDPREVLLLTFTDNAAKEMRDRIAATGRIDIDLAELEISTFHSMASRLLRVGCSDVPRHLGLGDRIPSNYSIVSNDEMAFDMFLRSYSHTVRVSDHADLVAILDGHEREVHRLVNNLMSHGIFPTEGGWFMDGAECLHGDIGRLMGDAVSTNSPLEGKRGPVQSIMVKRMKERVRRGVFIDLPDELLAGRSIPESLLREAVLDRDEELDAFIHDVYLDFIRASLGSGRLTFGMLIMFAFIALLMDPALKESVSFEHVMIDEFQDTNRTQFMMAMLLMARGNLCVVGDWRQGIFGFRDAEVENITEFTDRLVSFHGRLTSWGAELPFEPGPVIERGLKVNYRSSSDIIGLSPRALDIRVGSNDALSMLEPESPLETGDPRMDGSTSISYVLSEDEGAEMASIITAVQDFMEGRSGPVIEHVERAPRWSDVAVLTRSRGFGTRLRAFAKGYNVPMVFDGGLPVFNTREAKLALAWLRIIIDPDDARGWVTVLTDLGYAPGEVRDAIRNGRPTVESGFGVELRGMRNGLYPVLNAIFEHHGTRNDSSIAFVELIDGIFRSEMVSLQEIVHLIEANIESGKAVNVFMEPPRDAVRIHTIHGAKGLEYPFIVLANVNDDRFPSKRSSTDIVRFDPIRGLRGRKRIVGFEGMPHMCDSWQTAVVDIAVPRDYDEERRLLYVAITRAKQHLLVTSFRPSPFISSLANGSEVLSPGGPRMSPSVQESTPSASMDIPSYVQARRVVPVHGLMGPNIEGAAGKGPEFGIMVHRAAERIAHGHPPDIDCPEVDRAAAILDGLGDCVISTEVDCVADIDGTLVVGRVDLVADHGEWVEVIDYKTDSGRRNHGRYVIQMSAYHAAVSGATGKRTVCRIAYLSQDEVVTIEPLDHSRLASLLDVRRVKEDI